MKIYTRGGDAGQTSLRLGQRLAKDAARVEAYGSVDELNCSIGLALAHMAAARVAGLAPVEDLLRQVQGHLFDLGADLATPPGRPGGSPPRITETMVSNLEDGIDALDAGLPPLRRFILPGGSLPAAGLHVARGVCRRAERRLVTLTHQESVDPVSLKYLNRLSDYLFVAARFANHVLGVADHEVTPGG